jgi:hypothetical protein
LLPLSFAGTLSISSAAELNPAAVIYNYRTRFRGARSMQPARKSRWW